MCKQNGRDSNKRRLKTKYNIFYPNVYNTNMLKITLFPASYTKK